MRRASALVAMALAAAPCGGGGSNSNQSPSPSPSATSSGAVPAKCINLSSGPVFTLVQQNTAFHPGCLRVNSDQSIRILNKDSIVHNFTITGTQVDVDIQPGTTFNGESARLDTGIYQFSCKFHQSSGRTGTLVVE
jgi:plastocyanin